MRCKNCGTDNDENRYICEICGSPLYDENDIDVSVNTDNELTQTFSAQNDVQPYSRNSKNDMPVNPSGGNNQNKDAQRKSIILIAILAVVLVAIIVSVIVVAKGRSDSETTSNTSSLTTATTSEKTTKKKDKTTETTTESTTESTTEETTEKPTTTEKQIWIINAGTGGGGTVSGGGEYKNGDKVTVIATPDDGFEFDGWYSDGIKVSGSQKYSFTANENISLSAVFKYVQQPTNSENLDGGEE